jgi:hypothetical protein
MHALLSSTIDLSTLLHRSDPNRIPEVGVRLRKRLWVRIIVRVCVLELGLGIGLSMVSKGQKLQSNAPPSVVQ